MHPARIVTVAQPDASRALDGHGYEIESVPSGGAALHAVGRHRAQVVVTQLTPPDMNGALLCRLLRFLDDEVVIVVVAPIDGPGADVTAALEEGADDFVSGASLGGELAVRVRALLDRSEGPMGIATPDEAGSGLEILGAQGIVRIHGRVVALTKIEFSLLRELASKPGRVLSRNILVENVWGYDGLDSGRIVDGHIWRLRRKLAQGGDHGAIATLRGFGYKFVGSAQLDDCAAG